MMANICFDEILKSAALPFGSSGYWSARYIRSRSESVGVERDCVLPADIAFDEGVSITVVHDGGVGYACTSVVTRDGLRDAFRRAALMADAAHGKMVFDAALFPISSAVDVVDNSCISDGDGSIIGLLDVVMSASDRLPSSKSIVDWGGSASIEVVESVFVSSAGANIRQKFSYVGWELASVASSRSDTQTRTASRNIQGGVESVSKDVLFREADRIGAESVDLLRAKNCPSGIMDVLLMPSQMAMQIHESIAHPLELDRILGDERNYAGSSFVTTEMFGGYRYGSELLNVAFDPDMNGQYASFGYDDDGVRTQFQYLIRDGILERPIGSSLSQSRAGLGGVSCARASGWNRPPIDRIANINVLPGAPPFDELVSSIESGVLLDGCTSWSIDNNRNKFQFGCEYGRIIKDGVLGRVVKKSNYRGISSVFWRSLSGVGNSDTVGVIGMDNCGKGEANQEIHVGHSSPPCVFSNVDVFAGE